jgi:hypothetical protein
VELVDILKDYDQALSEGLHHFARLPPDDSKTIETMAESFENFAKNLEKSWTEKRIQFFEVTLSLSLAASLSLFKLTFPHSSKLSEFFDSNHRQQSGQQFLQTQGLL